MQTMNKNLQKIGASIVGEAKIYFFVLALALGITTSFVLVLGSVWSRLIDEFPDDQFKFIGGNMLFWATFVAIAMNIPLAVLGSLLLREQSITLIRFGLGRRHFIRVMLGQMWKPFVGALFLTVLLYLPFSALLEWLPDDNGNPLISVSGFGVPTFFGIVLAIISLFIPLTISVLFLSTNLVTRVNNSFRTLRSIKRWLLRGTFALGGTALIIFGIVYENGQQGGILFTVGILLVGSTLVPQAAPRIALNLTTLVARLSSYRPSPVLSKSVTSEYRSRFSGISLFLFLIASIPALLFSASGMQARAMGEGGIAQWDFWVLMAVPLAFTLLAIISASLILSQLLNRSLHKFLKLGIMSREYHFALLLTLASIVFSSQALVLACVLFLGLLMMFVWNISLIEMLSELYWQPLISVFILVMIFVPLLYLGFSGVKGKETQTTLASRK